MLTALLGPRDVHRVAIVARRGRSLSLHAHRPRIVIGFCSRDVGDENILIGEAFDLEPPRREPDVLDHHPVVAFGAGGR